MIRAKIPTGMPKRISSSNGPMERIGISIPYQKRDRGFPFFRGVVSINIMQRDFELIRQLLVFFDEKPDPNYVEVPLAGQEYTESQIKYHLVLLYQAGFLNCEAVKSSTSDRVIYVLPFDLTWEGHEFLAKIKNEGVWQKIRDVLTSKGGSVAFSVINQLATKFALQAAGV
jgi:hypothetical protein